MIGRKPTRLSEKMRDRADRSTAACSFRAAQRVAADVIDEFPRWACYPPEGKSPHSRHVPPHMSRCDRRPRHGVHTAVSGLHPTDEKLQEAKSLQSSSEAQVVVQ